MYKDGCSGGMSAMWRAVKGTPPPWEGCCDEHDRAYAKGGTPDERAAADKRLYECVRRQSPPWAAIMFLAVRLFGDTAFALTNRWGYGKQHGAE
jgi:hypothetical protein